MPSHALSCVKGKTQCKNCGNSMVKECWTNTTLPFALTTLFHVQSAVNQLFPGKPGILIFKNNVYIRCMYIKQTIENAD